MEGRVKMKGFVGLAAIVAIVIVLLFLGTFPIETPSDPYIPPTPECDPGYRCKDSSHSAYLNQDCSWSSVQLCSDGCINGKCLNLECQAGPSCVNSYTLGYLMPDCSWENTENCENGCFQGECQLDTCTAGWVCTDSTHRSYQGIDCSMSSKETCDFGCLDGSCKTDPCSGCSGSAGTCKEKYCENSVCKTRIKDNCCGNGACDGTENCDTCSVDCGICDLPTIPSSYQLTKSMRCTVNRDPTGCLVMASQSIAEYYGHSDSYDYIQSKMNCQSDCVPDTLEILIPETKLDFPDGVDPLRLIVPDSEKKSQLALCSTGGCSCNDVFKYFKLKGENVYCLYFNEELAKLAISRETPVIVGSDVLGHGHAYVMYRYDTSKIIAWSPNNPTGDTCFYYNFKPVDYSNIYIMIMIVPSTQSEGDFCIKTDDCNYGLACSNYICQR